MWSGCDNFQRMCFVAMWTRIIDVYMKQDDDVTHGEEADVNQGAAADRNQGASAET